MNTENKSLFIQFRKQVETFSSAELLTSAKRAAKNEQRETICVLAHLYEIDRRRLYAELEYTSLWAYAVGELEYSSPSAAERCEAMRLMYTSPLAIEKIESGELNLTNALQLQRHFKVNETSDKEKEELIKNACGKPTRKLAGELLKLDPHALPKKEKMKRLTEEYTYLGFVVDEETVEMIERTKELKGQHTKLREIFKMTIKDYLEENDPLVKAEKAKTEKTAREKPKEEKTTRAPKRSDENSRYIPKAVKNAVQLRSQSQCEYISETGKRCECRTRLEYDHIKPFAMGGPSTFENLRLVCSTHNKTNAIHCYGKEKMEAYIRC